MSAISAAIACGVSSIGARLFHVKQGRLLFDERLRLI